MNLQTEHAHNPNNRKATIAMQYLKGFPKQYDQETLRQRVQDFANGIDPDAGQLVRAMQTVMAAPPAEPGTTVHEAIETMMEAGNGK